MSDYMKAKYLLYVDDNPSPQFISSNLQQVYLKALSFITTDYDVLYLDHVQKALSGREKKEFIFPVNRMIKIVCIREK